MEEYSTDIGIYIWCKNCAQVDLVNELELASGRAIEACHVRHKTQIQKKVVNTLQRCSDGGKL